MFGAIAGGIASALAGGAMSKLRSEERFSRNAETDIVCRLLLEKKDGVVIMTHPTYREFNPIHHPSYIDFFVYVLADTTVPAVISTKWEHKYAEDEWYRHLYLIYYYDDHLHLHSFPTRRSSDLAT